MWRPKDASNDYIPGDLWVGVVGSRDFEFDLIGIIISEVRELNLENTIFLSDDLSFATIVASHTSSDGHVLEWVLVLRVDEFANDLSIFALWKDLVDWHVNDFCLAKAFDLLVLTDGHGDELPGGFKIVFCTRQHL